MTLGGEQTPPRNRSHRLDEEDEVAEKYTDGEGRTMNEEDLQTGRLIFVCVRVSQSPVLVRGLSHSSFMKLNSASTINLTIARHHRSLYTSKQTSSQYFENRSICHSLV
ncbi:unnamed protein product [Danaus chrysippus]|uniref:(African queen) hypothetical protein n=1 Tax=Danaus chrysippus TaxID=151541 RepID=A0A8J2QW57_9NEOP|nr:unnamed protein product [Danaus chrysippus]